MKATCKDRVVWIKLAGLLGLTIAYLSIRGYLAGLDALYRALILLAVTLIVTWLAVVWRPDCSVIKGRARVVFTLLFGISYGLVLWLWGTEWMLMLFPLVMLWVLLGPAWIRRHSSP